MSDENPETNRHDGKRVLIVDDNADAAEPLKEALGREGHEVVVATDPVEALEKARSFAPEVCILDIQLPIMDGYELGIHLRGLPNTSRSTLIALTGYGQDHDRGRSQAAGFAEYLVKPIDLDRLLRIVGTAP